MLAHGRTFLFWRASLHLYTCTHCEGVASNNAFSFTLHIFLITWSLRIRTQTFDVTHSWVVLSSSSFLSLLSFFNSFHLLLLLRHPSLSTTECKGGEEERDSSKLLSNYTWNICWKFSLFTHTWSLAISVFSPFHSPWTNIHQERNIRFFKLPFSISFLRIFFLPSYICLSQSFFTASLSLSVD